MTIFDKIESTIGNFIERPRGKHIAALFTAAALGTIGAMAGFAGTEKIVNNANEEEILRSPQGQTLVQSCMGNKEKSMRAILSATPITLGPAFTRISRDECLQDDSIKKHAVQDNMAYRSYVLLEGVGMSMAMLGVLGTLAGVGIRARQSLKR